MPDPKLDQVMVDVKQSEVAKGAKTDLESRLKTAEALKDVFAGIGAEQRKLLATELELSETFTKTKKSVSELKEALGKIPAVIQVTNAIQEKTGKSYKESLEMLKKSAEATKKHTAENRALLSAIQAVEKSHKEISNQLNKHDDFSKKALKSEKDINKELKERQKHYQNLKKLISDLGSNMKATFGAAGASGPAGMIQSMGRMGVSTGTAGASALSDLAVRKGWVDEVKGEVYRKRIQSGGKLMSGIFESIIDGIMYMAEVNIRSGIFKTRLTKGFGGPGMALLQNQLSREEVEKYGFQMYGRGIGIGSATPETELRQFAANSKLYGDEINANITNQLINSSGTVEKSWEHINILFASFKDLAKQSGVPVQDLMKWTAETASQARFLGVDYRTVAQVMQNLTSSRERLLKVGITREDLGGIGKRLVTGREQAPLALRAYWGQKIGLKGTTDEIIQQMSMGGKYMKVRSDKSGVDIMGEEKGGEITKNLMMAMRKQMLELGYTGSIAATQSGLFPGLTEKDVRALMAGEFDKLADKFAEPTEPEKSSEKYLSELVVFEVTKQKYMDTIAKLMVQIAQNKSLSDVLRTAKSAVDIAIDVAKTGAGGEKRRGLFQSEEVKKHIGGVINRGSIAEVLTNESFKSLGKDSFYAFNPSHDIQIGSPQTTKSELRKAQGGLGNSNSKIEVTLNVNGSILTDNTFLNKIEEVFARRMGLIGG